MIGFTFVLFFVCIILFHFILYKKREQASAKFWKATDYLWLSLAVLGLVGVATRFHQQDSRQKIHNLEQELQIEYDSQQSWILSLMDTDLQSALMKIEQSRNDDGFIRKEVSVPLMSRYHLSNLQLCLANKRPYIDNLEALNSEIEKVNKSGEFKNAANEAEYMIQRAIYIEKELKELRVDSSQSFLEYYIVLILPLFLAPALALRITKVTAEVFVLSKPT
ncbi:hypothetical protein V6x_12940 [Gimesia chilikensis]|uniref:Uncharacterized protein n=1 Tax=Gimesia chilikensis TaxID=2605989 RepID=A0A517W8N6_9PLAN|nr:hypothetical protein [Gimesia chilikensis]QDU01613.1 hypothetical protein V6x_12940 [Gimesia chilikensis]